MITGVIVDFQGRYWLNMGTSANIYLLNPATAKYPFRICRGSISATVK